ncbi:hypothetical protein [Plantactinospora sp. GCM10030261]|uniref:hypothetical protein n=1 Tax=Plantactinospora sp. GCM10030261 TaxID=3273420 RepID=UPI0036103017
MTRTITAVSDRLLALVAPKATAKAVTCSNVWCYCSGIYGMYRKCCYDGKKYTCGGCTIQVKYEC